MPPTIQSLLSARVDRLRSDERTVLELASVVGKEFYRGALRRARAGRRARSRGRMPREPAAQGARRARRDVLDRRAGVPLPPRRSSGTPRTAALLKETRAELHERVAEWLERKTAGRPRRARRADRLPPRAGARVQAAARTSPTTTSGAAPRSCSALRRTVRSTATTFRPRRRCPAARSRVSAVDDEAARSCSSIRCEALLSMGDVAARCGRASTSSRALADTPRLRGVGDVLRRAAREPHVVERAVRGDRGARRRAPRRSSRTLGDQAGAAKAHTVHAATLARPRTVRRERGGPRPRADGGARGERPAAHHGALGSAPHAALWGPNPVSRAGGRCLDIVRLLRITTGSPAVEATSLRCQAVLEALPRTRGRCAQDVAQRTPDAQRARSPARAARDRPVRRDRRARGAGLGRRGCRICASAYEGSERSGWTSSRHSRRRCSLARICTLGRGRGGSVALVGRRKSSAART